MLFYLAQKKKNPAEAGSMDNNVTMKLLPEYKVYV